jgi:TonB family protein
VAAIAAAEPIRLGRTTCPASQSGGTHTDAHQIVCSPRHLEPGVFGVAKPVLIWPLHLTTGMRDVHIEGILAHEIAHVKRRDNLLGVVQMLVSAACWFHPMVWWIGARMIDERERACDEQVLALGQSPSSYAAGILETCEMCITSTLVNVPGVTGGDLKKRICRIMRNEQGLPLGTARKAVLVAAVVALLLVPALDRAGAAPARQPAQDDDPSEVHQPGGDVQTPRLLKEVKPHYSERAKKARIEGEVLMECVVGADGKPRDFTIVRSLDPELDQAALDAARLWEFEPGTRRGKPVAVKVTIAMAFTLK